MRTCVVVSEAPARTVVERVASEGRVVRVHVALAVADAQPLGDQHGLPLAHLTEETHDLLGERRVPTEARRGVHASTRARVEPLSSGAVAYSPSGTVPCIIYVISAG